MTASNFEISNSGALKKGNLSAPEEATSIPQSKSMLEIGVCKRKALLPTCLPLPRTLSLAHSSTFSGFQPL